MPTDDAAQEACLIPGIPNDIATLCIARVPLRDQGPLRFVSKAWFDAFFKGEVYAVRKSEGHLEKFLIIFLRANSKFTCEEFNCSTESKFPVMMYDIESHTCQDLRTLLYSGYPEGSLENLEGISSGQDLFFVGDYYSEHANDTPTHPMWILRGECGKWEFIEGFKEGRRPLAFAHILDGKLFIGDAPRMPPFSGHIFDLDTIPWELTVRRFDMRSTWTTLKVPSPPLLGYNVDDLESFVKDEKLYCKSSSKPWHVFNPKGETWELSDFDPNPGLPHVGANPFTTVKETLFGLFWDSEDPWEDPEYAHFDVKEDVEMQVMWYKESGGEWVFLSKVPRDVGNKVKERSWYPSLQSLEDTLFVMEVACLKETSHVFYSGVGLSAMKLSFGESGISGEWELREKIFRTCGHEHIESCSVVEL